MTKNLIAAAIAATFLGAPLSALAGEAELMQRIEALAAELQKLKSELNASVKKTEQVEQRQQEMKASAAAPAAVESASGPATVLSGYGEVNYNRPTKRSNEAQADVRRAVIGIAHRFDEKTKVVAEFEWEHAVVSADDKGESEVEQMYVERQFDNGLRGKAGLFLMPVGLLNANHEPTAYYGVERNFVETAIIPSTWREAGIGLSGDLANGLSWDAGVTTGFDLTKWKDAGTEDQRESTLGAIHQEGMQAKSRNLSMHGALNWRGMPGLLLGGSVFTGKAGHKTVGLSELDDSRITVWDLHTRYTPGKWDLSALYARGHISNTEAFNATLAADVTAGSTTFVPKAFAGWYAQAAYQLLKSGDYTLSPFARYEKFNVAKSFSGAFASPGDDEKVTTVGANLRMGEGVVLKADYQKFSADSARNRVNLGLGFAY